MPIITCGTTQLVNGVVPAPGRAATASHADHASTFLRQRWLRGREAPMSDGADLIAAIDAGDATSCVQLLSRRDEKYRRAVYPELALRMEELEGELRDVTRASRKKAFEQYLVG